MTHAPRPRWSLPPVDDLPRVLLRLAVPHEDINTLALVRQTVDREPELQEYIGRCLAPIIERMGATGPVSQFPAPPGRSEVVQAYLPVLVFVAALPHIEAFHRSREVPADVSHDTLTDLGRMMANFRRRRGVGGLSLELTGWLSHHFQGALYQLGRLQFQRATLDDQTGGAIQTAGHPYRAGDPALAVHIPAFHGPMSARACDESFAAARPFFEHHFPEELYRIATCHSWLLDPQLGRYLPSDSNIMQFQRRFTLTHTSGPSDDSTLGMVFGREGANRADLPRSTVLERAVLDHLDAGRHWHEGSGWTLLDL